MDGTISNNFQMFCVITKRRTITHINSISMLEKLAKTRRNKRESTSMESSMIVLIVVVETLDFTGSREP